MGTIPSTASDKDRPLDALQQLRQAWTPKMWTWEIIICEARRTIASSTISQHVQPAILKGL